MVIQERKIPTRGNPTLSSLQVPSYPACRLEGVTLLRPKGLNSLVGKGRDAVMIDSLGSFEEERLTICKARRHRGKRCALPTSCSMDALFFMPIATGARYWQNKKHSLKCEESQAERVRVVCGHQCHPKYSVLLMYTSTPSILFDLHSQRAHKLKHSCKSPLREQE